MIIDIQFYRCYILVITADSFSSLFEFKKWSEIWWANHLNEQFQIYMYPFYL